MNVVRASAGCLKPAVVAAALFNLAPVIGVIFWGWSAFALIFLYWLENLVIGMRTIVSMLATTILGGAHLGHSLFLAAFFTVHYGIFCLGHGTFVVSMFGRNAIAASEGPVEATQALFAAEPGMAAGLASIVLWQGVQLVLFLGGFLLMLLNQPLAGLLLLALIKAGFDMAEARGEALWPDLQRRIEARLQRDRGG
jgi:hypothetical protein